MVYFTADPHFGHDNIIKGCNRPYDNVQEMNFDMIQKWNRKITKCDTVYILGDMFFRCETPPECILSQLNGQKHLIVGNHDSSWMKKMDVNKYFLSVNNMLETSFKTGSATICHYPMVTWNNQHKTYMIHGHIHNDTESDYWHLLCSNPRILNAGVDINNFEPVTLEELIRNNEEFKRKHKKG